MTRPMLAAAALLLCAALPATAQDLGGVRPRSPAGVLERIEAVGASGCRLSQTSVTVGVNRALASGSRASQQLGTDNSAGCRPLVSTQVSAGVNLALGRGSQADQSIEARSPSGLLATANVARGVNLAAGPRSAATQRILAATGR